ETFLLPAHYQTHAHLFVTTDATDVVFENGNEANNTAEAANRFDVSPTPYADLVVSGVSADPTGGSGLPLGVSWTVTNQSPHALGATDLTNWYDDLALATDPAGTNVVASLGSFDHLGGLDVGAGYTRTASVPLPNGLAAGTYYVVVKTG